MATIRQKSPGRWHVQIRRSGWPNQTKTLATKREAQAWARDVEGDMDRSAFVDRSAAERETLADVVQRFQVEVTAKRNSPESVASENYRIDRFLREEQWISHISMSNLRAEHVERYRDARLRARPSRGKAEGRGAIKVTSKNLAQNLSPGTVKKELTLLSSAIKHSKRRLSLEQNVADASNVKRPVVNDEREVRLSADEMQSLLKECRAAKNPYLAPVVEFAFETGARRGNILKLTWKDVDFDKSTAVLRGIKNSRNPDKIVNLTIGLSPRALEIIMEQPRKLNDRVFPVSKDAIKSAYNRARERAGLKHFRYHDSRHERISSLVEAGWSDTVVMAQTGHRDPRSLARYANLRKQFLADELGKLPSVFTGPEEDEPG